MDRSGLKVFAYGGTWLLAPHKRAARKQAREEFGVRVAAGDVERVAGPFRLYNIETERSWQVSEAEFVAEVQTYGEGIVCEG